MKKSLLVRQLRLLALFASCVGTAVAAPYGPEGRETTWTQPGGQVLNLRVFGDEYYARTETREGFTVYFNKADQTYYYAALGADGKSLVSSGVRADAAPPVALAKHVEQGVEKIQALSTANHAKFDAKRVSRWNQRVKAAGKLRNAAQGARLAAPEAAEAQIQAAPVSGGKRGLTILVQFPDDPRTPAKDKVSFPTTPQKIERFCNQAGYTEDGNTGSVRDYFYDQSFGGLTYTQAVTQVVTLPHPRAYYNYSDYPRNQKLVIDVEYPATEIIADAVKVLKEKGFDFSSLTLNEEGNVLATNVFFAGNDSGVYGKGLWPHQFAVVSPINVGTEEVPVYIDEYQITNIPDAQPVIGTFCHENGHLLLGYPDIYSLVEFGFGEGVGTHCLMGSGNYLNGGKTPAPINAYFKDLAGWANVTELAANDYRTVEIPSTGNVAYRITNPTIPQESYVVENRGSGDKWAKYTRDKGIIIWHIDSRMSGNVTLDESNPHYEVAVMQADGLRDLERGDNLGDNTDYFDVDDREFNDTTRPRSRWWNGAKSYVDIEVLSKAGPSMKVAFGGLLPDNILVDSPNGGEVLFRNAIAKLKWEANISGKVKIDLLKGGVFHSVIASNYTNDGGFNWTVPASLAPGSDYSIRVSSLTNKVAATDASDAAFTISDSVFPDGNTMPFGWSKPAGAGAGWVVSKSNVYEGARTLASGVTGDGQSAAVSYSSNFKAGTLSFYIKVSSEKGYDFARFYIDGKAQKLTRFGDTGISGDSGWTYVSFPISAGNHVFKWTYEKDDSYGGLLDKAWLDGVTMPATTQEIALANELGEDLVDGASSTAFPSTGVGYTSNAVTFTIKNQGKAYLSGLFARALGADKSDFIVQDLKKTALAPGESMALKVFFKPSKIGLRSSELRIRSNDSDETEFNIRISGEGLPASRIGVSQPSTTPLADNVGVSDFGKSSVGAVGKTKTFQLKNKGTAPLDGLSVTITGPGATDFIISPATLPALAPGDVGGFKVTFKPKSQKVRAAVLHVLSNDTLSGSFEVQLTGFGTPRKVAATQTLAQAASISGISKFSVTDPVGTKVTVKATAGVEVIAGKKYRSLTITKNEGVSGTVEVSSNLMDWYSGRKHTTVLLNDATTLKVRDNTPFTADSKRYIRLK